MDFGTAIRTCFQKYAVFNGRARRSEYWYFVLFGILINLGTTVIEGLIKATSGATIPISTLASLALFLPNLAVNVRRLHDTDRSGWLLGGFYIYCIVAVIAALPMIFSTTTSGATFGSTSMIVISILALGAIGYGIFLFVLTVLPGTNGTNNYGPDPKAPLVDVF